MLSMSSNTAAFQKRSIGKTVALSVVTFGLYGLYWAYQVHQEFAQAKDGSFDPTMRTVGLIIPVYNFLALWKTSNDAEELLPGVSAITVFVTAIVFFPIAIYLVQDAINQAA